MVVTVPHRTKRQRFAGTRGFSLIEVIAVIGIVTMMSTALLQVMYQYGWITRTSRYQLNEAMVARAVFDEFRQTLRDVVRIQSTNRPVQKVESPTQRNGEVNSADGLPPAEASLLSEHPLDVQFNECLVGGTESFLTHTSGGEIPERRWVMYGVTRQDRCELPANLGSTAQHYDTVEAVADDTLIKLSTLSQFTGSPEIVFQSNNIEETQLLTGIENLTFSYFDGFEWHPSWDSRRDNRLPMAIGIELTFRQPDNNLAIAESINDRFATVIELVQR